MIEAGNGKRIVWMTARVCKDKLSGEPSSLQQHLLLKCNLHKILSLRQSCVMEYDAFTISNDPVMASDMTGYCNNKIFPRRGMISAGEKYGEKMWNTQAVDKSAGCNVSWKLLLLDTFLQVSEIDRWWRCVMCIPMMITFLMHLSFFSGKETV